MSDAKSSPKVPKHLTWPIRLTRAGMIGERGLRAFWPLATVLMAALAALMFGAQDVLPLEAVWGITVLVILASLAALIYGIRQFHFPRRSEALARLDESTPGRPIAALMDTQVIGANDAASAAVWAAHRKRMEASAASARAPAPNLQISRFDPYALRYAALLALVMALLFGSFLRVGSVGQMAPGSGNGALASGPSWEGWIEPPAYTGKPALYLNDIAPGPINAPKGSEVTLRLYGEVGALSVAQDITGQMGALPDASLPEQSLTIRQSGTLAIEGQNGAAWQITAIPDVAPVIRLDGMVERAANGEMQLPFAVLDDYGITAGRAIIRLDLATVPRRYGYIGAPEARPDIVLDLPMTISGDRRSFAEVLIENLSEHPWADLPVEIALYVDDAAGQTGQTDPLVIDLPAKRFFDPVAAAVIEERRELLWNISNAPRVAQVLRAISYRPDDLFNSATAYLKLRIVMRRLEEEGLSKEARDEIAQVLWDIAVQIEDGLRADAAERLRQAQDKLSEAIKRGASDDEIAGLMDELREAMDNYVRQLAQQQSENGDAQQQADAQNMQQITGDQIQQMMDRLQELMEQGRTAEAQELLEQLRQLMENIQVAQGQGGQGQQSQSEQAMNGLSDTLREQQGLNDETFSDLQDQFNQDPGADDGAEGDSGDEGGGESPEEGSEGPRGDGEGSEGEGGQQGGSRQGDERGKGGSGVGGAENGSLADRQKALQDELNRQKGALPGGGGEEGEAAREAIDRAGRAMKDAENALREDDFAGALDSQSEAMEALRDGMRNLAEQMAQERSEQGGQQGEAMGRAGQSDRQDPLGRNAGSAGQAGTQDQMLQGEDVYRRARELLDEIRRRSSDQERPDVELEYLKRLLDRF
ncbi:MAG: TIGR02302 family protein [Paracoccaceae bacterium]